MLTYIVEVGENETEENEKVHISNKVPPAGSAPLSYGSGSKMKYTNPIKTLLASTWVKGWAYSSKEDFENASAAYSEVTGLHGRVKSGSPYLTLYEPVSLMNFN